MRARVGVCVCANLCAKEDPDLPITFSNSRGLQGMS